MVWIYRILGVAYMVLFFVYFVYRASYSIGDIQVGYRITVLVIEFLASVNVIFVVFLKLRKPWTEYANQVDGATAAGLVIKGQEEAEGLFTPTSQRAVELPDVKNGDLEDGRPVTIKHGLDEEDDDVDVDQNSEQLSTQSQDMIFNVRVLVPCYKEDLEIVANTCLAALKMNHPRDNLFVYLLDDGADENKIKWVQKMSQQYPNLFYVTRPLKYKGHGKAGNLNYTLEHIIYGSDPDRVPKNELVAIFDADMVAAENFAARVVPYFQNDRKCVLVQTPQTFHNVPMSADFFDAHNLNFFQYMLPAMSEWNTTTCCGTNFMVAARALARVGWFPTISVTEDMYLAMKLLSRGGVCKYHAENLSVGEAPQDIRQIFQQRSRWAKGTIQIFLKDSPLKNKGLNLIQKLSFFNAIWSYLTSAFFNPLFVVINSLGILFGLFPIKDVDFDSAMLFIGYYTLFFIILHFTPNPKKHYIGLWIVSQMGHFFSFMALKAIFNVIKSTIRSSSIVFKVTKKTVKETGAAQEEEAVDDNEDYGEDDEEYFSTDSEKRDSSRKDIIFHFMMVILILFSMAYGIYVILGYDAFIPEFEDKDRSVFEKKGIRLFAVAWMCQFFISYSLPIWYAYLPNKFGVQSYALNLLCKIDTILSLGLLVLTVILFKIPFLRTVPEIDRITAFPPAVRPFWVTAGSQSKQILNYILEQATDKKIPMIVVYNRPQRDLGSLSRGGANDWIEYSKELDSIAASITSVDFPVNVVLEPDWMMESMSMSPIPGTTNTFQVESNDTLTGPVIRNVYWNAEKWYNLVDLFVDFANKMHPQTYVYVDAAHVYYHELMNNFALKELYDNIGRTRINGLAFNVANFYPTNATVKLGKQLYKSYNWHFIVDTSRNGGKWTNQTYANIDSCRFDPPFLANGTVPGWAPLKEQWVGYDGNFWVKIPGESDGRLYPAGEYHSCLMGHNIPCSSECPMIPPVERDRACFCD
jgi:cellulose synthase/poly-beta-1,6-N-acetylglucosamine synthase-like glycosyltransferase